MSNDIPKEIQSQANRKYAGFNPRMLAHNIDLIVLLPLFYLIGFFEDQNGLLLIYCVLLYIIYYTISEISPWRGTLGKKLQKIKVQADNEQNEFGLKHALIRNVAKIPSTVLLFSGFILVIFDQKKRGLHDRMAKTVVIFAEN